MRKHVHTTALTISVLIIILAETSRAADSKKKYITTSDGKRIEVEQSTGGIIPEAVDQLRRRTNEHIKQIIQEETCIRDGLNVWECPATKLDASKFSDKNLEVWIQQEKGDLERIKMSISAQEKKIAELKKYSHFKNLRTLDHVTMERDTVTAELMKQRIAILKTIKKTHQNPEDRLDLYNAMFRGDIPCGFFLQSNPTLEFSIALFSNDAEKTSTAKMSIDEHTKRCQQLMRNLPKQESFRPRMR